ncbi:hypothetical protein FOCC_FOCC013487 [Frankliniella occidentalis]|nr:hypothetical protein FOCC_FOCC013487 [Frankliniella occidentalis]
MAKNKNNKSRGLNWDAVPTLCLGGSSSSSVEDPIEDPIPVLEAVDHVPSGSNPGASHRLEENGASSVPKEHCYAGNPPSPTPVLEDVPASAVVVESAVPEDLGSASTSGGNSTDTVDIAAVEPVFVFSAVPATSNQSNVSTLKKTKRFRGLPQVPRLRKCDKTPVTLNLLETCSTIRRRHLRLRKNYLRKCQKLQVYKFRQEKIALSFCKDRLPSQFYQLLCCQLRNSRRKPRGYRYTEEDLSLFLDWYERSPKLYRVLGMIKPQKDTLKKLLKSLNIQPGINPAIMAALSSRANALPDDEREVSLIMDGVAVKIGLIFNSRQDIVKGLVRLSGNKVLFDLADEALVFMVRSIYGTWKQPVCYYLINGKMTGVDFKEMILEVIEALQLTNLNVRVTINDGLGKNRAALELLGASYDTPYFYVNGKIIFTMYDYVHCFKNMRNNLMTYPLKLKSGKVVHFEYIKAFVERDLMQPYRLAPKLTKTHINPNSFQKQRVNLATQLFSKHVAAGKATYALLTSVLPQEAMVTANFVSDMNDLFDSMNGTKLTGSEAAPLKCVATKGSPHIAFWDKWSQELDSWEFIGSKCIVFHKQWAQTLRAAIIFAKSALEGEGKPHFPMGHCNQDPSENYFSWGIRGKGGHRTTPDSAEFESAFGSSLVNTLTYHNKGQNCRSDKGVSLLNLKELLQEAKKIQEQMTEPAEPNISVVIEEPEETEETEETEAEVAGLLIDESSSSTTSILDGAGLSASAHPLVKNFLQEIKCEQCEGILHEDCRFPVHFNMMQLSSNPNGKFPSASVVSALDAIHDAATEKIADIWIQGNGVMKKLVEVISDLPAVRVLKLCPAHVEHKAQLLKHFARKAIEANMKWAVDMLKPVQIRKPRQCKKLKVVQHR